VAEAGPTAAPPPNAELTTTAQRRARRARATPQPHDGWTFVVVPPGAHSRARTVRFSVRRLRAVAAAFAASLTVTLASGVVLVLLVATLPPLTAQRAGVELGVLMAAVPDPEPESPAVVDIDAVPAEAPVQAPRPRPPARSPAPTAERPAATAELADMSGLPVIGRITSRFSSARRHPMLGVVRRHNGIDIAAPAGTPITAPHEGTVHFVGRRIGYGIVIEIDHGNGVLTRYAHCKSANVEEGNLVRAGQQIGTVGATGLATGPHLHFEIIVEGRNVNPLRTSLASLLPFAATPPAGLSIDDGEADRSDGTVVSDSELDGVFAPRAEEDGGHTDTRNQSDS
jgi:murein DD-endopeptidase MepM/ murein hydrolase activator NlpD